MDMPLNPLQPIPPSLLPPLVQPALQPNLQPPAQDMVPVAPLGGTQLEALPHELKAIIASNLLRKENDTVRLVNRSFRQAGAERLIMLKIAAAAVPHLPSMFNNLPMLREVHIDGFQFNTDDALMQLDQCAANHRAKVRTLNICGSDITDAGMACLASLPNLHSLDLTLCGGITDDGLGALAQLTALQSLKLACVTPIGDAGIAHLRDLTNMRRLDLSFCNGITAAGLASLNGMHRMEDLNLSFCQGITDPGLQCVMQMAALQTLDLAHSPGITANGIRYLKSRGNMFAVTANQMNLIDDMSLTAAEAAVLAAGPTMVFHTLSGIPHT